MLLRTCLVSKFPYSLPLRTIFRTFSLNHDTDFVFSSLQSLWFTIAVWRTLEAPRFKPGFIFASILGVVIVALSLLIRFLEIRDGKIRAQKEDGISDTEAPSVIATESDKLADAAVSDVLQTGEAAAHL